MRHQDPPLVNPTWEEMVERDPLLSFSWYLSGRKTCLLEIAEEIRENEKKIFGWVNDGETVRSITEKGGYF
jgi:hypothetical protein